MHHLLDGLVILERPMRKRLVDRVDVLRRLIGAEVAVAAGPVGTAQPGGAQAHPGAEDDNNKGEERRRPAPGGERGSGVRSCGAELRTWIAGRDSGRMLRSHVVKQ